MRPIELIGVRNEHGDEGLRFESQALNQGAILKHLQEFQRIGLDLGSNLARQIGQTGVVVEGQFDDARTFVADSVLAKHDENYMPPEVMDALKEAGTWQGDGAYGAKKESP